MQRLEAHWKDLKDDYKMVKVIGKGTFGTVVKAIHRKS
jgi:serine/threonine protein kinase